MAPPTNVVVSRPVLWDIVVDIVAGVEVEGLECVKDEIAHVLVHVRPQDAPVKVIYRSASVHHLTKSCVY